MEQTEQTDQQGAPQPTLSRRRLRHKLDTQRLCAWCNEPLGIADDRFKYHESCGKEWERIRGRESTRAYRKRKAEQWAERARQAEEERMRATSTLPSQSSSSAPKRVRMRKVEGNPQQPCEWCGKPLGEEADDPRRLYHRTCFTEHRAHRRATPPKDRMLPKDRILPQPMSVRKRVSKDPKRLCLWCERPLNSGEANRRYHSECAQERRRVRARKENDPARLCVECGEPLNRNDPSVEVLPTRLRHEECAKSYRRAYSKNYAQLVRDKKIFPRKRKQREEVTV